MAQGVMLVRTMDIVRRVRMLRHNNKEVSIKLFVHRPVIASRSSRAARASNLSRGAYDFCSGFCAHTSTPRIL
jgi:hypothetical protein